ncbi:hypothetical protein TNCV_864341 [Trichonephila clavipes]|nr:hypothetical protein TNCV_864341 [Trichonephila clavipes]
MRRMISAGFPPSVNKKRITALLSYLVQIDNEIAMLNGLLHSNDYEGRRVTRCFEVLPTTPHSMLDTSAVAKLWKEKSLKSLYFLTFPRIYRVIAVRSAQGCQIQRLTWDKDTRLNIREMTIGQADRLHYRSRPKRPPVTLINRLDTDPLHALSLRPKLLLVGAAVDGFGCALQ